MRLPRRCGWLVLVTLVFVLDACVLDPEKQVAEQLNAHWGNLEQHPSTLKSPLHDLKVRLWQDRPDYSALIDDTPLRYPRAISLEMPEYPWFVAHLRLEAFVNVSIVIGEDGNVEAARVLKSSDSYFDESALEAAKTFKFKPAQGPTGPRKFLADIPIHYLPPIGNADSRPAPFRR
jgi:TonB family protein